MGTSQSFKFTIHNFIGFDAGHDVTPLVRWNGSVHFGGVGREQHPQNAPDHTRATFKVRQLEVWSRDDFKMSAWAFEMRIQKKNLFLYFYYNVL